ncbi:hypothetical protein EYF80_065131 [Liparis tanakae]|uniref:Uncharacterized protein n=1 Tax=Liparis tanakae TaxID=230148 RepID=A0A4Z2E8V8_9TELE|nr:hypothetical protein EYF80_065131 [Liparis tanakae]
MDELLAAPPVRRWLVPTSSSHMDRGSLGLIRAQLRTLGVLGVLMVLRVLMVLGALGALRVLRVQVSSLLLSDAQNDTGSEGTDILRTRHHNNLHGITQQHNTT